MEKACRDVHDYMQKDSEFTAALHRQFRFAPEKIIYHDPETIVYWADGTETVVKCAEDDEYSEYAGFVAAVAKKMYGGANAINRLIESKKMFMRMNCISRFAQKPNWKSFLIMH